MRVRFLEVEFGMESYPTETDISDAINKDIALVEEECRVAGVQILDLDREDRRDLRGLYWVRVHLALSTTTRMDDPGRGHLEHSPAAVQGGRARPGSPRGDRGRERTAP